jgi:hypothetical protein
LRLAKRLEEMLGELGQDEVNSQITVGCRLFIVHQHHVSSTGVFALSPHFNLHSNY